MTSFSSVGFFFRPDLPRVPAIQAAPATVGDVEFPCILFIDKNDILYVADSQSNDTTNPGFKQGIRIGSVKDGKVTAFIPWAETGTLEGVAADDQGNVCGGFTNTLNFRRFVKK